MDADQLFARHREHVEGVIVAKVGLHREREFGEIGELPEIGGMHAGRIESLPVMRDVVVGMPERPGEPRVCSAMISSREARSASSNSAL
jgi:hypothetical protein